MWSLTTVFKLNWTSKHFWLRGTLQLFFFEVCFDWERVKKKIQHKSHFNAFFFERLFDLLSLCLCCQDKSRDVRNLLLVFHDFALNYLIQQTKERFVVASGLVCKFCCSNWRLLVVAWRRASGWEFGQFKDFQAFEAGGFLWETLKNFLRSLIATEKLLFLKMKLSSWCT